MLTSVYVFIVKYFSALPPNPPAASPKVRRNNLVRWRNFIKSVGSTAQFGKQIRREIFRQVKV